MLNRRQLLQFATLSALSTGLPFATQAANAKTAIVIGAGIAGLAAAKTLQAQGWKVTVLEGRDRLGGRIWTDRSLGAPMDMGASWIHGPQGNPITALAKQAQAKTFVTDDESVQVYDVQGKPIPDAKLQASEREYDRLLERIEDLVADLDQDISVSEAVRRINPKYLQDLLIQYQLTAYTEFDAGGPIEKLSAQYWDDDENYPGEDVLFPDGYDAVINLLAKGLNIKTRQVVQTVRYDKGRVTVKTNQGEWTSDRAVITLPLGVLKKGAVTFTPGLPSAMTGAIQRVPMGMVNKAVLMFPKAFWDVNTQYFGYTAQTKGKYPYFLNARTFSKANALMTFGFGNYGLELEAHSPKQIESDIMQTLRVMFGSKIPAPTGMLVSKWTADPFAYGAYSYVGVGSQRKDFVQLGKPVNNLLFFAGEHTSAQYRGTVHGAYLSGLRAAKEVAASV